MTCSLCSIDHITVQNNVSQLLKRFKYCCLKTSSMPVLSMKRFLSVFLFQDSMKMSVCVHENRKSRASTGSMNIYLFHKSSYADSVLMHLNALRQQRLFTDVLLHAGNRSFPCHRAVLAACSRYFEAMFSGGLRESQDSEVDFRDSIHPEVLL